MRSRAVSLVSVVVYPVSAAFARVAPVVALAAYLALPAFFIRTLLVGDRD